MRLFAGLLAFVVGTAIAFGQAIPFPGPGRPVNTGPAVLTYQSAGAPFAPASATVTWTGQTVGSGAQYTIVAACISKTAGTWGGGDFSSATVGGNAVTFIGSQVVSPGANEISVIGIAAAPVGPTATITFNMSASAARAFLSVWSATSVLSATPTATANNSGSPPAASLTINTDGFGVGYGCARAATATWTNMTERDDQAFLTVEASGADNSTAASATRTYTPNTGTDNVLLLGAWR